MKGFMKFVVLAIAGFALGAGAAWLQSPHRASVPQMEVKSETKAAAVLEEKHDKKKEGDDVKKAESAAASAATDEDADDTSKLDEASSDKPAANGASGKVAAASEAVGKADESPEVMKNLAAARGDAPTTETGVGGAFSMVDSNGNAVTDKSWPGKYLLVFFGFTNCPDVCPVTLDKLTSALDQLGDDAQKVQPLFISIDAGRDKPRVLKEYLSHFHKSFLGLTGTDEQIKAVEDEYKVFAARHDDRNGHDYSFDHSAFVYFMGPDGKMAEIIKADDKASDIADVMRPWLEGKKEADSKTP